MYHTNARWLSLESVLTTVWELKEEIVMFFEMKSIVCDFSTKAQNTEIFCISFSSFQSFAYFVNKNHLYDGIAFSLLCLNNETNLSPNLKIVLVINKMIYSLNSFAVKRH